MTTPPVIVCPLNAKAGSERAIRSAYDTAALFGGSLELFSAVEDQHMVGRRQLHLEQIGAATNCGDLVPSTETRVVVDPHAPWALATRAAHDDTTMVMATSTQPVMHPGYLGSAAERVIRGAANPTLLVGPQCETRLRDVRRVVVPCDGSKLSETALPVASHWANQLGVELWVITVIEPSQSTSEPSASASAEVNYVRRLADPFSAQWDVLHATGPAKAIVDWAGPALIVMTTHGRSGLRRLALGSVTVAVTRHSVAPVLAVHQS